MRPCFICGADSVCEHRETALLASVANIRLVPDLHQKFTEFPQDGCGALSAKEYRAEGQLSAMRKLAWAVRTGKVEKSKRCWVCGLLGYVEAHHEDYAKPLEVVWVCRKCHRAIDTTGRKRGPVEKYPSKACG